MKTKKAIELILMPKTFYTLKELKSKISILFSFFVYVLEARKQTTIWLTRERSWSNSRAWFLILGQNSEVKLMPK